MTFLASLAASLIEWLLQKGWVEIVHIEQILAKRKQITSDANASVEPLKNATTGDAIDSATDTTLNGT